MNTRSPVSWRRRLELLLGIPASDGNLVEILRNGDEIFAAMLDAIRSAERSIDMVTFVFWRGDVTQAFTDALSERAAAGVRVRLLLDTFGSRHIAADQVAKMRTAGVDLRWFRPIEAAEGKRLTRVNRRTHRKVLVCDERVGFTGGVGIAEEWTGTASSPSEWRDTHFRVVGPAVDGLHGGFIDNWLETGPLQIDEIFDHFPAQNEAGSSIVQVIRGAAEAGSNDIANLFEILFREAERHIRITTAYFNPDDEVAAMLVDAAHRGVEVDVLVPGRHADKRFVQIVGEARYAQLMHAGINIRVYDATMLHAKIVTVDGIVAPVGSANINQRSMQYDEELNLVVIDPTIVAELDADFAADVANSTHIDAGDWAARGPIQRAAERAVSVVADLI